MSEQQVADGAQPRAKVGDVIEAPQLVLDRIVDGLIEASPQDAGFRWVFELDACRLDWRRRDGLCPCGVEVLDGQ